VALDRADGPIVGIPHDSVIETRAHELVRQLSRPIQARQIGWFAAHAAAIALVWTAARAAHSIARDAGSLPSMAPSAPRSPSVNGPPLPAEHFHPTDSEAIPRLRGPAFWDNKRLTDHLPTRSGCPFTRRPTSPNFSAKRIGS
jgi:hypothetical protein